MVIIFSIRKNSHTIRKSFMKTITIKRQICNVILSTKEIQNRKENFIQQKGNKMKLLQNYALKK